MMDSHWRMVARSNMSGLSKTQTLKNFPQYSESWEQVKDGWETMDKYRECAGILALAEKFDSVYRSPHPRTSED